MPLCRRLLPSLPAGRAALAGARYRGSLPPCAGGPLTRPPARSPVGSPARRADADASRHRCASNRFTVYPRSPWPPRPRPAAAPRRCQGLPRRWCPPAVMSGGRPAAVRGTGTSSSSPPNSPLYSRVTLRAPTRSHPPPSHDGVPVVAHDRAAATGRGRADGHGGGPNPFSRPSAPPPRSPGQMLMAAPAPWRSNPPPARGQPAPAAVHEPRSPGGERAHRQPPTAVVPSVARVCPVAAPPRPAASPSACYRRGRRGLPRLDRYA